MSIYDFFFPQEAQAMHLRTLATQNNISNTHARLEQRRIARATNTANDKIDQLEDEIGQLTIVMEALIECFEEQGSVSKLDLAKKIGEIDARDGVIDGRITKEKPEEPAPENEPRKLYIPKD